MLEHDCSVTKNLEIIPAGRAEYCQLSTFHYRQSSLAPYAAIYAMKDAHPVRGRFDNVIGVIVYTMAAPNLELRNIATGGKFCGFGDRKLQLQMVNEHLRCISRVIIEPRYRGLGLASRLVRQTLSIVGTPIVEAMAVMGRVNRFFERAGMRSYTAKMPARCAQLIEAFGMVGINENLFIDPAEVQRRMEKLQPDQAGFIAQQIRVFLEAYGKRKHMPPGIERTRYVLSKLSARPVYYIWFRDQK